jgi:hemolysin III
VLVRRRAGKEVGTVLANIDHGSGALRPRWRGWLHAAGAAIFAPACLALVVAAPGGAARVGAGVFALALVAVYATSATYHLVARTPVWQRRWKRLDHSMIYVLIAGTQTPVCLLALPQAWAAPMLVLAWTGAAAGVVLALTWRAHRFGCALYLLLGWAVAVAMPTAVDRLDRSTLVLLGVGGAAYTVGAVLFFLKVPRLRPATFGYHECWHSFTLVAGIAHFAAVASMVA